MGPQSFQFEPKPDDPHDRVIIDEARAMVTLIEQSGRKVMALIITSDDAIATKYRAISNGVSIGNVADFIGALEREIVRLRAGLADHHVQ